MGVFSDTKFLLDSVPASAHTLDASKSQNTLVQLHSFAPFRSGAQLDPKARNAHPSANPIMPPPDISLLMPGKKGEIGSVNAITSVCVHARVSLCRRPFYIPTSPPKDDSLQNRKGFVY